MSEPVREASLKDRLLALARGASGTREGLGDRLKGLHERVPARGADLRDKVRMRIAQLAAEQAELATRLGAKVEQLVKPRAADGAMPDEPAPHVPPSGPATAAPQGDAARTSEGVVGEPAGRTSVVTRTFGRVGLTLVQARLAAMAKVRQRRAVGPAVPTDGSAAEIVRIDAALPLPPVATAAAVARAGGLADTSPPRSLIMPRRAPIARDEDGATVRSIRRREEGRSRLAGLAGTLATALVTAGVLHIAITLALPATAHWFGKGAAFHRLKFQLETNRMKAFSVEASAGAPLLPFLSPDMSYAFCRYDVSAGPVAVSAVLPDVGWSLALYTPQGDNYYAAPGQSGRTTDVNFLIVAASDRLINLTPGVRRADVDATQVTSPQREGLIVVRAPYRGIAFEAATRAALAKASCQPARR
jgi:uncharacterized membrane protein